MRSLTVFVSPRGCRGEPDRVVRLPGISLAQVRRYGFSWVEVIGGRRFLISARYLNHQLEGGPTLIETSRQELTGKSRLPFIEVAPATPFRE